MEMFLLLCHVNSRFLSLSLSPPPPPPHPPVPTLTDEMLIVTGAVEVKTCPGFAHVLTRDLYCGLLASKAHNCNDVNIITVTVCT